MMYTQSLNDIYNRAMEFLAVEKSVTSLDFSLDAICDDHNWGLIPIHAFCKKRNYDVDFMMDRVLMSRFGTTIHFQDRDEFCIAYNDALEPAAVRFIIAHEISHIILRHFETYPESINENGVLMQSQYALFEKDANLFARFLLAPPPILEALSITDASEILSRFSIPADEALALSHFLKEHFRSITRSHSQEAMILKKFGIPSD